MIIIVKYRTFIDFFLCDTFTSTRIHMAWKYLTFYFKSVAKIVPISSHANVRLLHVNFTFYGVRDFDAHNPTRGDVRVHTHICTHT